MDKKQLQILIALFPILLIGEIFCFYKYFFSPIQNKEKLIRADLEQIKKEYRESVGRISRLPKLEQEISLLNQEIAQIEKKLPNKKDVPGLIRLLSKKMDLYGITWSRLAPGSQSVKDYYAEYSYTIPFTASYHQLASFLSEIGQMERIFATRFSKLSVTVNASTQKTQIQGELLFLIYTAKG